MTQIVEIKDNPFWEYDVNKAIYDFEAEYGVEPNMIIGKNFIELVAPSCTWVNEIPIDKPKSIIGIYKGVSCEYDPDISCVILKA
jgi:hypothetical protein